MFFVVVVVDVFIVVVCLFLTKNVAPSYRAAPLVMYKFITPYMYGIKWGGGSKIATSSIKMNNYFKM